MFEIGLAHYLTLGAILFTLGVFGIFLNRKNVIIILMSIELILLAININLVSFSSYLGDIVGQVFALFVLTVAAAEAAIGLAILVVYFRNRGSIAVEDIHMMKGLRYTVYVRFSSIFTSHWKFYCGHPCFRWRYHQARKKEEHRPNGSYGDGRSNASICSRGDNSIY